MGVPTLHAKGGGNRPLMLLLFSGVIGKNEPNSLEDDLEIKPNATVADVFKVQVHPFVKREVMTVRGDLP